METRAVISRKSAVSYGFKRYYTGRPCPNGHQAERYVKGGQCCECHKGRAREQRRGMTYRLWKDRDAAGSELLNLAAVIKRYVSESDTNRPRFRPACIQRIAAAIYALEDATQWQVDINGKRVVVDQKSPEAPPAPPVSVPAPPLPCAQQVQLPPMPPMPAVPAPPAPPAAPAESPEDALAGLLGGL